MDILFLVLKESLWLFTSPIMYVVLIVCYWQNKRFFKMKSTFFEIKKQKVLKKTLLSCVYGFIAGIVASVILIYLGVDIFSIGLEYIWPFVVILVLINVRFICLSYAGGIVGILAYFGIIEINFLALVIIVATLHLLEGVLIFVDGKNAIPIYIKKQNNIVGAYNLQNFWPLPLVLVGVLYGYSNTVINIDMPLWWPLFADDKLAFYSLIPVVAALGYGDITSTMSVKKKANLSAMGLVIYACVLFILAFLCKTEIIANIICAILMPILHEGIIYLSKYMDTLGEDLYVSPKDSVKILECGTDVAFLGIKNLDVILMVDEIVVHSKREIMRLLQNDYVHALTIKRDENVFKVICESNVFLDIICAPSKSAGYVNFGGYFYLPKLFVAFIKNLAKKVKNKVDMYRKK